MRSASQRRSEEAQAAVLPLIADVRLDERVGDARLHGVQGAFKVSRLHPLGFDVVLQSQQGGLPAHRRYLRQETDTRAFTRPLILVGTLWFSLSLPSSLSQPCCSAAFKQHKTTITLHGSNHMVCIHKEVTSLMTMYWVSMNVNEGIVF